MYIYELAALGAALSWAFGGLISVYPSNKLGAIRFNRIRMIGVSLILVIYATFNSGWSSLTSDVISLSILSGLIGILVGDTALFLALNRVGPRRISVLFSLNAPLSALLAWVFLDESLSSRAIFGIFLCITGVIIAIMFSGKASTTHQWETVKGKLWIGIALGLSAALAQSIGTLIARPVMESGADPAAVSAIRTGIAAVGLTILLQLNLKGISTNTKLNFKILGLTLLSGTIGMAVGMTLLLFALSGGKVGIVATLSSTTPVIILPLIWIKTGKAPSKGAWIGALLVIIGCGLIFSR